MKKTSILVLLSFLFLFSACKKENEPNPADNFVGFWNMTELYTPSGSAQETYEFEIVISKLPDGKIQLLNFSDITTVSASVSGNSLTIAEQLINVDGVVFYVNGTGTLTGNVLNLTYTFKNNAGNTVASATASGSKE